MKKSTKLLMTTLLVSLGLAACGGNSTSTSTSGNQQSLTITTFGELATLDSADYDDVPSSDMLGQIFEGLYRVAKDNKVELGMAAEEPTVSADGLVYTFKLRDAKWSDGTPDKTLEITLENPAPYLPKLLTGSRFLPQSEKVAKEKGDGYGSSADSIVTNGPFKLEGWTGSELSWKLVKNEGYWDAANVQLQNVTVNVSKEVATSVQLFDGKQVQYTTISEQFVDQYKTQPTYHSIPKATMGYMNFNVERKITGNKHFRRAIAMAYDKAALVNNVLKDGSIVSNGLVPKGFAENPETGKDYVEDRGDLLTYNVEEAQKELALAKQELGMDTIEVTLLTSDAGSAKVVGEYLQAQIQKNLPGVTLNIKSVPLKNRLELQRADDFDFFFGTWAPDYQDPVNFLEQYVTGGGINFGNYSSEAYDKAVAEVKTTYATKPAERYKQMIAAEKIVMDDVAIAPIYQASQSYLLAENVDGFEVLPFGRTINLRQASVK